MKRALKFESQIFTPAEINEMRHAFEYCDADKDGNLEESEILEWFRCLGWCFTSDDIDKIVKRFGTLTLSGAYRMGFVSLCRAADAQAYIRGPNPDNLERALQIVKSNSDGQQLTISSLREALTSSSVEPLRSSDVEFMLKMCDIDPMAAITLDPVQLADKMSDKLDDALTLLED